MTAKEILNRYAAGERDFTGFDLRDSYLRGLNLSGANFSGAKLSRANLSGADLSGAHFFGAKLYGASLSRADLFGAKNIYAHGPAPTSGRMVYFVRHEFGWMVQAGCFWGDLDELEMQVKEKHNCPWYLGLIEMHRNL